MTATPVLIITDEDGKHGIRDQNIRKLWDKYYVGEDTLKTSVKKCSFWDK